MKAKPATPPTLSNDDFLSAVKSFIVARMRSTPENVKLSDLALVVESLSKYIEASGGAGGNDLKAFMAMLDED